jgi:4-hydroxyphenylpyruvate dioxygenase-like putative hemolysin
MQARQLKVLRAAVKNVDEALATFQKNFGFALTRREGDAGAPQQSAFLRIGGAEIEVVQAASGLAAETIAERGEGLFELVLEVADLEAARRHLEASGIRSTSEADAKGQARLRVDLAHTNGTPLVLCAATR